MRNFIFLLFLCFSVSFYGQAKNYPFSVFSDYSSISAVGSEKPKLISKTKKEIKLALKKNNFEKQSVEESHNQIEKQSERQIKQSERKIQKQKRKEFRKAIWKTIREQQKINKTQKKLAKKQNEKQNKKQDKKEFGKSIHWAAYLSFFSSLVAIGIFAAAIIFNMATYSIFSFLIPFAVALLIIALIASIIGISVVANKSITLYHKSQTLTLAIIGGVLALLSLLFIALVIIAISSITF